MIRDSVGHMDFSCISAFLGCHLKMYLYLYVCLYLLRSIFGLLLLFFFFLCCLCAACAVKMFTTAHNSFARLPDSFCSTRRILGILQLEFIGLWVRAKELTDMQSHSDAARRNVSEIILTHIYTFCFLSQNLIFCCCCCAVKHTYECIFVTRPSLAYYIY